MCYSRLPAASGGDQELFFHSCHVCLPVSKGKFAGHFAAIIDIRLCSLYHGGNGVRMGRSDGDGDVISVFISFPYLAHFSQKRLGYEISFCSFWGFPPSVSSSLPPIWVCPNIRTLIPNLIKSDGLQSFPPSNKCNLQGILGLEADFQTHPSPTMD